MTFRAAKLAAEIARSRSLTAPDRVVAIVAFVAGLSGTATAIYLIGGIHA